MNTDQQDSIYSLLRQQGPFATGERPPDRNPFSTLSRQRARKLLSECQSTKYRVIRNQIFELLDVASYADIQQLLNNPERRRSTARRAYKLIGNMFGIDGNEREIVSKVNNYARTADAVIRYLKSKVLANYAPYLEMTNEIDALNNPVELLLIIFDDRYHQKARFEAKRKLILMELAGSIEQRERETDIENKFARFLHFLNEYVWSSDTRIGELESVFLVSTHDQERFSCTDVKAVPPSELTGVERGPGRKITLIKQRRFQYAGRKIPIYVTVRKKAPEAKVLKLIRKGEENPAVAVDDELGLMGVLATASDMKIFQKHLTESAIRADSFMTLEEISDSLNGCTRPHPNIGSAPGTPMLKFFARMGGMRVEFIIHTYKSYLDYLYEREVAHDEYEVRRLFDSGTAELLFPEEIYHLDMQEIRDDLIRWFRQRLERY